MFAQKLQTLKDSSQEAYRTTNIPVRKRTKLHNADTVHWLRKRFPSTANVNYIHYPEELQKHNEVQNIFQYFDEDHSGSYLY